MIAINFIDRNISALNGKETIGEVLLLMKKLDLKELPVLENNLYKGMISETDLINMDNQEGIISDIPLHIFISVLEQCHFFEIWSNLLEAHLSCIPVVNENNDFIGCILKKTILQFYQQSFALTEPGSIIILSQRKLDYSLAKIASLVEQHDSVILSSIVTETSDPENILITIKLNKTESQAIINSLQRYDMDIVDVFSEESFNDTMKERFNLLMSYLNV